MWSKSKTARQVFYVYILYICLLLTNSIIYTLWIYGPLLQPQLINSLSLTISISHLSPLCLRLHPCQNGIRRRCWVTCLSLGGCSILSLHTVAVKLFSTAQIFMSRSKAIMLTGYNRLHSYSHASTLWHFLLFPMPKNSTGSYGVLNCSV